MHFQLLMKYLGQIYTYNKCSPRWLFWPDRNVLSPYRGGIWAPSSYKPFWSHRRRRLSQCQVPANSVSAHNEGCSLARWKHIIWELISEVACTLHYIVIVKHVYWTRFQNMSFFATSPPYKSPSPYSGPSPSVYAQPPRSDSHILWNKKLRSIFDPRTHIGHKPARIVLGHPGNSFAFDKGCHFCFEIDIIHGWFMVFLLDPIFSTPEVSESQTFTRWVPL